IGCPFLKFFETPAYHKNAHANHHRHCSDRWLDILARESGGEFRGGDLGGGVQGYTDFWEGGRPAQRLVWKIKTAARKRESRAGTTKRGARAAKTPQLF